MAEKKEIKIAAGILLYRKASGKTEVFLAHTGGPYYAKKDDGAWSFPKGEQDDPNEALIDVAKREFKEETSFPAPVGEYVELGTVKNPNKIVHVWAVEGEIDPDGFKSNTCMVEYPPRSGKQIEIPEMDRGEYFDLETARKKLYGYLAPIIDVFEQKNKMNYWLVKSEGNCYSIDDLKRDKKTAWEGIRNFQARNFMKDGMKIGDLVFFYHSMSEPTGVYGIAKVVSKPHIDESALNPKDEHYDPKAVKYEKEGKDPLWVCVDLEFVKKFEKPVSLLDIKMNRDLEGILVARRGQRLSVMPVSAEHFKIIEKMGK